MGKGLDSAVVSLLPSPALFSRDGALWDRGLVWFGAVATYKPIVSYFLH